MGVLGTHWLGMTRLLVLRAGGAAQERLAHCTSETRMILVIRSFAVSEFPMAFRSARPAIRLARDALERAQVRHLPLS
jgi:hypothetical protein